MLRGSKAVVTGASRGIGFAIAKLLAENGCKVVITGRNEDSLRTAASRMNGTVKILKWDVSDIHRAEEMLNTAIDMLGGMDILVNNAGIFAQRSEWNKNSLLETRAE